MDLKELIDKRIDDKLGGSQGIQRVPAKVLSVTEGFKRADVKLANGAIIKDMLNKTGEELDVGQGVYVEYMTLPSSGYIAMTTGECRPLGGGGGAPAAEVENAAVITTNPDDYIVTEELMLDISPETMLYYGNMPAFMVVQGHYCLMCPTTNIVQYSNGQWIIGQTEGLYERILANRAKFGSQIGSSARGGILYCSTPASFAYPNKYIYQSLDVYSIGLASSGYTYTARINMYNADVNAPVGNWWEQSLTWGSFTMTYKQTNFVSATNTSYIGVLNDAFLVPVISTFINAPNDREFQTPYGYCAIHGYLVFASSDGEHYGVVYVQTGSGGSIGGIPLISDAENCFCLGISQRTEPVYPNSGGGA